MDYAGAIIKRDNKYILQLRDDKKNIKNPGKWGTFGGGIEKKESSLDAIKRELKEELRLKILNPKLFLKMKLKNKKYFIYKIILKNENLKLMEGKAIGKFSLFQILYSKNIIGIVRLFFMFYPMLIFLRESKIFAKFTSVVFLNKSNS